MFMYITHHHHHNLHMHWLDKKALFDLYILAQLVLGDLNKLDT